MGVEGFLSGKPDEEVTARGIQPFYTGILARMVGLELKIGIEGDTMKFTATPAVAAGAEAA
jgi:histidine phosphotransferase ChpT